MVVPSSSAKMERLEDENVGLELEHSIRTIRKQMQVVKLNTHVKMSEKDAC